MKFVNEISSSAFKGGAWEKDPLRVLPAGLFSCSGAEVDWSCHVRPHNVIALSPRRNVSAVPQQLPLAAYDPGELEFGEYGRDPCFLPGWWIVPTCFLIVVSVCVCLSVMGA